MLSRAMIAGAVAFGSMAGSVEAAPGTCGRAQRQVGAIGDGAGVLPLHRSGVRSLPVRLGEPLPPALVVRGGGSRQCHPRAKAEDDT